MKYISPKSRTIFFGVALVSVLVLQIAHADQVSVSFNEDVLVTDDELSLHRGQGLKESTISVADLNNNVINVGPGASLTNGNNVISDGAFNNSSGIASVIQNSGNNVIIQDSTVVNVSFQ
jgi:hypothetical protein